MRIVSLACSNTEIVAALGYAAFLVGVDDHSDHPPEALRGLPRVGPDLEIDVDAVASLRPDLVLASLTVPGHETVVEGIEAAGLPLLTLAPERLDQVAPSVVAVAEAMARVAEKRGALSAQEGGPTLAAEIRGRGAALADRLERAFQTPALKRSDVAESDRADSGTGRPSILVQWWPKPVIAPGARSWVHGMIELAGGRNALGHEDRLSRPLDDAEVAALAPDIVVVSWCGVHPDKYRPEVVYRNPAFADLPAIRNRQVHCIPEGWMGRPGPRLPEGIEALSRAVEAAAAGAGPDARQTR